MESKQSLSVSNERLPMTNHGSYRRMECNMKVEKSQKQLRDIQAKKHKKSNSKLKHNFNY